MNVIHLRKIHNRQNSRAIQIHPKSAGGFALSSLSDA